MVQSVCVFAGSSPGIDVRLGEAAAALGAAIADRRWTLVYGGASVGLMGVVADAALARGGRVVGVLPDFLAAKEIAHGGLSELQIVPSMHARKAAMADRSDAFVALPGGFGTLEEWFEVITWAQLGLHRKPCGLLNVAGFYDPLLAFLDTAVRQQFIKPRHRELVVSADRAATLLDRLSTHPVPPTGPTWVDPAEARSRS